MNELEARSFGQLPMQDDPSGKMAYKTAVILAMGLGIYGSDWVTDTTKHTGKWWIFHAVTDCVISEIDYFSGSSSGFVPGTTLLAGDRIYGNILGIKLASGTGELYRAIG